MLELPIPSKMFFSSPPIIINKMYFSADFIYNFIQYVVQMIDKGLHDVSIVYTLRFDGKNVYFE